MISLNYRDSRPIYEQIEDGLRKLIVTGALGADEKLPSVRALAAQLAINPNTIQRAYAELEREGFIYTVKGRGNFVAYDEGLLSYRKKEIYSKLDELIRKAGEIGISRSEMSDYVKEGHEAVLQGATGEGFGYD